MWGGDLVHLLKGAEAIWLVEGKPSLLIKDQHHGRRLTLRTRPTALIWRPQSKRKTCQLSDLLLTESLQRARLTFFILHFLYFQFCLENWLIGKWFKGICPFGLKVLLPKRLKSDGGLWIILNQQYSGPSEKLLPIPIVNQKVVQCPCVPLNPRQVQLAILINWFANWTLMHFGSS